MLEWLDSLIHEAGPVALLGFALAAALEYVVPPFPGDSIVLLGGIYAVRGQHPWYLMLVVVTAGSLVGASVNYWMGTRVAVHFERHPERPVLGLTAQRLAQVHEKMERWGGWLLVVNRFLPGVRGVIFLAAGAARLPFARCLVLGGVSAVAHGLVLLALGMTVGGNLERLTALVQRYQRWVLGLMALAALGLLVRYLARRKSPAA
jgi:membrane protein DedA with SNARE-associated domain